MTFYCSHTSFQHHGETIFFLLTVPLIYCITRDGLMQICARITLRAPILGNLNNLVEWGNLNNDTMHYFMKTYIYTSKQFFFKRSKLTNVSPVSSHPLVSIIYGDFPVLVKFDYEFVQLCVLIYLCILGPVCWVPYQSVTLDVTSEDRRIGISLRETYPLRV